MGRRYAVAVLCTGITAAKELVQIAAASNKLAKIKAIHIEQSTSAGDASAKMLRFTVYRAATTTGTSTSFTPSPLDPTDTASGFTAVYNSDNTKTLASTPGVSLIEGGMNNQAGWHWTPDDQGSIRISGTTNFVALKLQTAPAVATDFEITLEMEEEG